MNRRKFFKWLGVGAAVAAVAPSTIFAESPLGVSLLAQGTAGEYYDYVNFSEFALKSSIDDIVSNAAAELGAAAGRELTALQVLAGS